MTDFDRATTSGPAGDDRRSVTITDDWDTPNQTRNGGYILALMAEAMRHSSPKKDVLSAAVSFLKPTPLGEAEVACEVVRDGRRTATVLGRLLADGQVTTTATITFADRDGADPGYSHPGGPLPDLPPPEECVDAMAPVPQGVIKIADHFDYRHREVPGWARGEPSGDMEATFWTRFADGREPDDLALLLVPDAYPPVIADIGMLASATVQFTVHVYRRPSPGWLLVRITTDHVIDGFHDENVEVWDGEGHLVAQSRQLAILTA